MSNENKKDDLSSKGFKPFKPIKSWVDANKVEVVTPAAPAKELTPEEDEKRRFDDLMAGFRLDRF